jgi:V-type H+-transporting ATPase subunit a
VNPAVYTIMTFPFLFAVMFGDFGHGLLMLAFALFLVLNEKKLAKVTNEIFGMAYGGRYCILLMSIFSIYVGLIYNEFFSIPMSLFGTTGFSCKEPFNSTLPFTPTDDMRACGDHHHNGEVTFAKGASPYPLGVDPVWHGTKTELPFLNSMKMKLSILLGVVHMNLGILMSLYNHVFFRDTLSIVCEFIPQVIFLNSLFGYLCLLIIGKWVSGAQTDLYHVMIYMFLSPGNVPKHEVDPKTGVTSPNISTGYMFDGQGGLQGFLVLIAVIAVPWMLIPKPFILKKRHEASTSHRVRSRRCSNLDACSIPYPPCACSGPL